MSFQQIKREIEGLKKSLCPDISGGQIVIYDSANGIPEELLNGDMVRVFIPDNGRDPGISQLC